jgi:hypothetical protein
LERAPLQPFFLKLSNTGQRYIPDWSIISSEKREIWRISFTTTINRAITIRQVTNGYRSNGSYALLAIVILFVLFFWADLGEMRANFGS